MLSGLISKYDQKHSMRIEKEIKAKGGSYTKIPVITRPVMSIINEFNIEHIDYCSIDTEGSEFAILQSFNFDIASISVFSIENNYGNNEISNFLIEKNYTMVIKIGADEIYMKNE